ncbi:MAG: transcription termination/antitermination NusG family protein [Streptobacillus sp.]|jgi:nusG antitermination factor
MANVDEKQYVNRWYLIHTYSGYERKVRDDLTKRIISEGLNDKVFRILVPEEEVEEIKIKKRTGEEIKEKVLRKIFPSYVMVEMRTTREQYDDSVNYKVDSKAWYIIRNTNGVMGFVGVGSDPLPMSDKEVEDIFAKMKKSDESYDEVDYKVGDYVSDEDGNGGTVVSIDLIKKEVNVETLIGSRPTILTFEMNKVTKFVK